jgi:Kef-type K+ transport system membrane component KefB
MLSTAGPVATIGSHQLLVFLLQVALLLGMAVVLGRVAVRFTMPALVGELAAGVLLGPSVLAHLAPGLSSWLLPNDARQLNLLDAVGQFGVLLLVGIAGMSINLPFIRRQGSTIGLVSTGALVVPLALGFGVGFLVPSSLLGGSTQRPVFALFLGVAMAVSAIPVIAKTLLEMRLLDHRIGQMIMGAAAVDDIIGWMLLSIVAAMAGTGVRAGDIALSVTYLVALIAVAVLIGRPAVRGILALTNRSTEPGLVTAVVVVLLMLSAAATQALGMEGVLGTFLCGMLIGSSGLISTEQTAPLRTLVMTVLAPLYFATAGLRMNLTALGHPATLGAAALILLVAIGGKFGGAYVGARAGRVSRWESLALGAGLNARGVVEVIVAMVGLRLGVLGTDTYTIIVLVALVTSMMAPPLLRYAVRRAGTTAGDEPVREDVHAI